MLVTDIRASAGESPVTPELVKLLIQDSKATSGNDLISEILAVLSKKSSKHKFIVQGTSVDTADSNFSLSLSSDFGAVWESDRDGFINAKVDLGSKTSDDDVKSLERADTLGGIVDHYIDEPEPAKKLVISIFWVFVG